MKYRGLNYCILFLLFGLLLQSCRKIDKITTPTTDASFASAESRFFNAHRTDNVKEQRLVNYLIQRNDREHFVLPAIARIGYPRWNKTVLL